MICTNNGGGGVSEGSGSAGACLLRIVSTVAPSNSTSSSCMNGGVNSIDFSSAEESAKLERDTHLHGLTSPIIADLPLMSMRSPPLSLDFTASEVCKKKTNSNNKLL